MLAQPPALGPEPRDGLHLTGAWTDYIYADGKRIAKVDFHVNRILTVGSDTAAAATAGGGWSEYMAPNAGGLNGYVIQSGDKLFVWQFTATSNALAGVGLNL